jgi:predicted HNH restriction endonuclease
MSSIFFSFFFINTLKDEILTSQNTLLRMTEWVDEDCHVVQSKDGWMPRNDGLDRYLLPRLALKKVA